MNLNEERMLIEGVLSEFRLWRGRAEEMLRWLDEKGVSREQYAEDEENPTEREVRDAYRRFGPGGKDAWTLKESFAEEHGLGKADARTIEEGDPDQETRELQQIQSWLSDTAEEMDDWDWDGDELTIFVNGEATEKYTRADLEESGVIGPVPELEMEESRSRTEEERVLGILRTLSRAVLQSKDSAHREQLVARAAAEITKALPPERDGSD